MKFSVTQFIAINLLYAKTKQDFQLQMAARKFSGWRHSTEVEHRRRVVRSGGAAAALAPKLMLTS